MAKVALENEDWQKASNLNEAFDFLKTNQLMNVLTWRRIHCVCCREVWEYITDSRSRTAVETAESYLNEVATIRDLQAAFASAEHATNEAWSKVRSFLNPSDTGSFVWPVSKAVDEAWIEYLAASAAQTCAETSDDTVLFSSIPDAVRDIPAWRDARFDIVGNDDDVVDDKLREVVLKKWDEISCNEENRLVCKIRQLVEGGVP